MILAGDLGAFDSTWAGWTLRGQILYSPEGWEATMGDIRTLPLLRQFIATLRADNRILKMQLDEVEYEEQPLPSEVLYQIK